MENGILFDLRDTKDPCQFLRLNLLYAASISLYLRASLWKCLHQSVSVAILMALAPILLFYKQSALL